MKSHEIVEVCQEARELAVAGLLTHDEARRVVLWAMENLIGPSLLGSRHWVQSAEDTPQQAAA